MHVAAANPNSAQGHHWTEVTRLVPSFGVAQCLQALTGFLVARLLLPAEYGMWSLFAVVLFYCAQLHLGSINLMHKEVPSLLATKDSKAAAQVTNFAFSFSLTNCALAGCGIGTLGLIWRPPGVSVVQIMLLALLVVSQELFTFANYWLRAYQRFSVLSRCLSLYACCTLALVASFAWRQHLTGVLLGYVLSSGCVALYFIFEQKIKVEYVLPDVSWKSLGSASLLLLWTMMFVFLTTMDRLFIGWRMGMFALGLFGVSLLLSSVVYNTADAVLQVLFPAASSLAARSPSSGEVTGLLLSGARTLSYILAAVLGLGFLLLPTVVPLFLPRYSAGIAAARIVCLGLGPLALGQLISVNLVVLGKVTQCLMLQGSVLMAKLLLLLSLRHPQLTSVALISSLANALYLLAVLAAIAPASLRALLKSLTRILAPWFVIAGTLLIVNAVKNSAGGRLSVLPTALYLLLALPLLWAVHRRTQGAAHV